MRYKNLVCSLLIYSIWSGVFAPFAAFQNRVSAQSTANQPPPAGLQFRLREAAPAEEKPPVATTPTPAPQNLSATETAAIFQRLPPLLAEKTDKSDFALRSNTQPPPKTGNMIPLKFPADERLTTPKVKFSERAPLTVVRFSPEGNVPLASTLSITFSQPMISVTARELTGENVPVKLTPEVKGKWRWIDTKTLVFKAETRLPMATEFKVNIPAGTRSATGETLAKPVSWKLTTPPPTIEKFAPNDQSLPVEPRYILMAARFNQEIDANAIVKKMRVTANGKPVEIRPATEEERAGSNIFIQQLGEVSPKYVAAFRAIEPLPLDATIRVMFEEGLPSAEGQLVSAQPQNFSFKTLGPFKLSQAMCIYPNISTGCQPADNFILQFSHSFNPTPFDPSLVKIEPAIENAQISANGPTIYISGKKKFNTIYKVTVSGELTDFYKRKLGNDVSVNFNVGLTQPRFFAQGGNFVTLDPNAAPSFSVYSLNQPSLKIKIYSVTPAEYEKFRPLLRAFYNSNTVSTPDFGQLVVDQTIETQSKPDELIETRIDLRPALPDKFGHVLLIIEPADKNPKYIYANRPVIAWAQATNTGIDAFVDHEQLTAFTTDLKTGRPLVNAEISLHNPPAVMSGVTNQSGMANFQLTTQGGRGFLSIKNGADTAIFPEPQDYYETVSAWSRRNAYGTLRWFVFDDRQMYRPKEEVSIKGYLRNFSGGTRIDISEPNSVKGVDYVLRDARGLEIIKGTANLNVFGAFDLKFKLPDTINLGYQRLELRAKMDSSAATNGVDYTHGFQVQEFRRPEFEVSVKSETPAPLVVGNSANLQVEAKYFAGGPLSNTQAVWSAYATETNYTPPNRSDFTFGTFIPWWRSYQSAPYRYARNVASQSFVGKTDADGKHRLAVDLVAVNPARPFMLNVNANIQDVNRQNIADSTSLIIHPAELYVGLRTAKNFVRPGEVFKVETITTDTGGRAVPDAPVTITAELKEWQPASDGWKQVTIDTQTCRVKSAGEEVVSCDFKAKQGGTLVITASVLDNRERRNESSRNIWVQGGKLAPKRAVEREQVELIPDKKDYAPGEAAEISVNSPFFPAEGVLTLRRNGIVKTERFTLTEASTVLRIPIEEGYLPNIYAQVDLVGAADRTNDQGEIDKNLAQRPAFASGALNLNVSKASRKLIVTAEPVLKTLEPSQKTDVNITVKDAGGRPVANSEVALVIVDESVLSLTNYQIPNPLETFYQTISPGVFDFHSRERVVLGAAGGYNSLQRGADDMRAREADTPFARLSTLNLVSTDPHGFIFQTWVGRRNARSQDGVGDDEDIVVQNTPSINLRKNFNALAIFSPSVITDANGKAVVNIQLLDNLTRYRITAVAVTKSKQFGSGESNITAKQPLIVRPSAPRFMNFGDRTELPVVVQNQTEQPLTVNVAVRAANAVLTGGSGRRITVAANDRAEIRFPVAADKSGTARFQIGAVSGNFADAAEIELPVYTPATTETFAAYGTTDKDGAIIQPVTAPKDVFGEFGGLEITTSSTQLQELTDAFIYLQTYPFSCSEQIASRVLSTAALRDVLTAFDAKDLPSKTETEAAMKSNIDRLKTLQHADGGYSFWRSDDASLPFISVHVAHALARARAKGYAVPPETIAKALGYLKNIEAKYPQNYDLEWRWAISAYALYVRDLLGDKDIVKAQSYLRHITPEKLSPESIGWLLSVFANDKNSVSEVAEIKRHLLNRVTETAGSAHFVTNYKDGEYILLSSERRADAVILEALLRVESQESGVKNPGIEDLIPKIVRGLLANRTKGRWANTQENVFVLLALDKYFQTFEKETPNFVTRVWLGNAYAGEQNFKGRSVDSNLVKVPMNYLQQQKSAPNLILDKQGSGRLYYRIGLNYAPKNLKLKAADAGFIVSRSYEAVDKPEDVKQNPDGSWIVKAGTRVRVKIQLVAPTRRYHVALVDKLPAGFEIINSALATAGTRSIYQNNPLDLRKRFGFEHQNLRDERAEAFKSLLDEGVWDYSYVVWATTPGQFVVPPAKAEEMYAPETFGRSAADFVKVE